MLWLRLERLRTARRKRCGPGRSSVERSVPRAASRRAARRPVARAAWAPRRVVRCTEDKNNEYTCNTRYSDRFTHYTCLFIS